MRLLGRLFRGQTRAVEFHFLACFEESGIQRERALEFHKCHQAALRGAVPTVRDSRRGAAVEGASCLRERRAMGETF